MTRPAIEVADIVRRKGRQFLERFKAVLNYQQLKAYRAVKRCRTAALGGHRDKCDGLYVRSTLSPTTHADHRCCPKCQAQARKTMARDPATRSLEHQLLPRCLHPAPRTEPAGTDFTQATASTCCSRPVPRPCSKSPPIPNASARRSGSSPSCTPGVPTCCPIIISTAVVPGGGLSADHKRWIHTSHAMFLLPVPVLRTVFRKKFLAGLCHLYRKGLLNSEVLAASLGDPAWFEQLINKLRQKEMVRLCQAALRRPRTCAALPRPLHPPHGHLATTASPPSTGERVSFLWRDYAHGGKQRVMTLDAVEFLLPLLPARAAKRLRAHPPLWPALQPLPQRVAAPGTHTARPTRTRTAASSAPA